MTKMEALTFEGKYVFSKYFKAWIQVFNVTDNYNWSFFLDNKVYRAKTPLSYFKSKKLVKDSL